MLLAALMLLTGMLGQVGHAWAHGNGSDPAAAWLVALEAERSFLAGSTEGNAEATVQVFGVEGRHDHGDGPAHQHDGPEGLLADHAHGVAFLLPILSCMPVGSLDANRSWALSPLLTGALSYHPDRPPRGDTTLG